MTLYLQKKSGLYDSAAEPASDFELPQTFHSHSTSVMETTPKSPEIEAGDCITTEEGPVESSEQALVCIVAVLLLHKSHFVYSLTY